MDPQLLDIFGMPRAFAAVWAPSCDLYGEGVTARAASSPCHVLGCCWTLYELDRLHMHVFVDHAINQLRNPAIVEGSAAQVLAPEGQIFREAFTRIWRSIPDLDRTAILRYWRHEKRTLPLLWQARWSHLPCMRPLIRIVEDADAEEQELVSIAARGLMLTFQASECRADSITTLERTILEQLLLAYRHSNREHEKLEWKTLIEPFHSWEEGAGANTDEDERDARWDELKSKCNRLEKAAQRRLATRWGMAELYSQRKTAKGRKNLGSDNSCAVSGT
jgi:hypothetical protein